MAALGRESFRLGARDTVARAPILLRPSCYRHSARTRGEAVDRWRVDVDRLWWRELAAASQGRAAAVSECEHLSARLSAIRTQPPVEVAMSQP